MALSFGDCFSYALALSRGDPLLFVCDDFSHTDVIAVPWLHRAALLDFIICGVPFAYATSLGPETRGVPTAHAAPPLISDFSGTDAVVWPSASGKIRGAAVQPLYAAAPASARRNPALYELLTLVDALRVGRARERQRARTILRERLQGEGRSA